jgi:hypothetical protein
MRAHLAGPPLPFLHRLKCTVVAKRRWTLGCPNRQDISSRSIQLLPTWRIPDKPDRCTARLRF